MKRILIYPILAVLLAACTADAPDSPDKEDNGEYEMCFEAFTPSLSRATGIYAEETYPVSNLYLTAFHTDNTDYRQYYFIDKPLTYVDETSPDYVVGEAPYWKLSNWYWPIQGKMSFLSYWCPGFSKAPGFDEIYDADNKMRPRMTVDATTLDGKTDFLFLSQEVDCPQISTTKLLYTHGLAWIKISLKAEVYDDNNVYSETMTNDLIDKVQVTKVVIEDCARKGTATVVPGNGSEPAYDIIWKTYDNNGVSYVRDQVYYNDGKPVSSISDFEWKEYKDASDPTELNIDPANYLTIEATEENEKGKELGKYSTSGPAYVGEGLLIVPQNKTAITVSYIVNGTAKEERFELRDNTEPWLPGYYYEYQIVFNNYTDVGAKFTTLKTWSGVNQAATNHCLDSDFYGRLRSTKDGTPEDGRAPFTIEPMHEGGSGTGDDMDYVEGPRVF